MVTEKVYKPGEASKLLRIPSSTLRVYSTRFADLLSPGASNPPLRGGRVGQRLYLERDLAVLRKAQAMLSKGMTYEEALRELRWALPEERFPSRGSRLNRGRKASPAPTLPPSPPTTASPSPAPLFREDTLVKLVNAVTQAQKGLWQELVEEVKVDLAELKRRVRALEERMDAYEGRPGSFWDRFTGR